MNAVVEMLDQQVNCYRKLAKLAELQHVHVQQGQVEELLEVLSKRQEVLDVVADLEKTLGPVKKRWGEYVGGLGADDKGRAEGLLAESKMLLEEITRADRDDVLMLQQRKLNLGKQISAATNARQVNRNYATAAYGSAGSRLNVGG
jgi:hypothetical protein